MNIFTNDVVNIENITMVDTLKSTVLTSSAWTLSSCALRTAMDSLASSTTLRSIGAVGWCCVHMAPPLS